MIYFATGGDAPQRPPKTQPDPTNTPDSAPTKPNPEK